MKRALLILVIILLLAVTVFLFLLPNLGISFSLPSAPAAGNGSNTSADASSAASASTSPENPPPSEPLAPHPADTLIDGMTLEEQVAQLFLVRCPETDAETFISTYQPGGLVLFAHDFEGGDADSIREIMDNYQMAASIPLLLATDEEGGSVVRISRYESYRRWPFQSPQELFEENGVDAFVYDTAEKDALFKKLGLNVNLAPVCDVSVDENDFMYDRTLGQDANATAEYAETVVGQMKKDGVGAVLKHFPGYGPNGDSHESVIVDERPKSTFEESDLIPFSAGIDAGAGGVLLTHNIVSCYDADNPASLSPAVYAVLRGMMGFDGVAITDDLAMEAITSVYGAGEAAVKALTAGCDLLLSSDFETQYAAVLAAAQNGTISADRLRESLRRVLQWKADLGLIVLEDEGPDTDVSTQAPASAA